MRADIVAGAVFPDYELTDHKGKHRKLSDLQGPDPMIVVLSRGGYCPKDRRQAEGLVQLHHEMEVGYSRLVTISTDNMLLTRSPWQWRVFSGRCLVFYFQRGPHSKLAAIIADVTGESPPVGSESPTANHKLRAPLSTREVEVLRLVVQGLANKEIAVQLKISESAVKNTLQQLFAKTEVRTRSQLVRVALEQYRALLQR